MGDIPFRQMVSLLGGQAIERRIFHENPECLVGERHAFEPRRLLHHRPAGMTMGLRQLLARGLLALNRGIFPAVSPLSASKTSSLVFAPHPDDEVLGCGGVLAIRAQAGMRVKVVIMTDGRTSHSKLIDASELTAIRRAEAEEAGRVLGVSSGYEFLEIEDHQLARHRESAMSRVVDIIRDFKPDEVFVPHRRDLISDHVETYWIVRRAVEQIGRPAALLEYPIWLWNGWPWTANRWRHECGHFSRAAATIRDIAEIALVCRVRFDISGVKDKKRAALDAYRSQMQRLNGSSGWAVLSDVASGEFLKRFQGDVEMFRRTDYRP